MNLGEKRYGSAGGERPGLRDKGMQHHSKLNCRRLFGKKVSSRPEPSSATKFKRSIDDELKANSSENSSNCSNSIAIS